MSLAELALIAALYGHLAGGGSLDIDDPELPPIQETGIASWYGDGSWHGDITANGETFDPHDYTCAHRHLPFDTMVLIENPANSRRVWCRINDRGPYAIHTDDGWDYVVSNSRHKDWTAILDLSIATAEALDTLEVGVQQVHIRYFDQWRPSGFHVASMTP